MCGMPTLPTPGTDAHTVFVKLMAQMSRAGRRVDFEGCAKLAHVIQNEGERSAAARAQALALGLDPKWLPWRRR